MADIGHRKLLEFVRLVLLMINYFTFVGSQIIALIGICVIFEISITNETLGTLDVLNRFSLCRKVDLKSLSILISET